MTIIIASAYPAQYAFKQAHCANTMAFSPGIDDVHFLRIYICIIY